MNTIRTHIKEIVFIAVVLLAILDFHHSASASDPESNNRSWGCIKTYRATVFADNSTKSARVTRFKKHTPVHLLEQKLGWTRVKGYTQEGWTKSYNIKKGLNCALVVDSNILVDSSKNYRLSYHQALQVIKQDFGKNLVRDRYRREFWVYSRGLWPEDPQIQKVLLVP